MGKPITQETLAQMVITLIGQQEVEIESLDPDQATEIVPLKDYLHRLDLSRRQSILSRITDPALIVWDAIGSQFDEEGNLAARPHPFVYSYPNGEAIDIGQPPGCRTMLQFLKATFTRSANAPTLIQSLLGKVGDDQRLARWIAESFLLELIEYEGELPSEIGKFFKPAKRLGPSPFDYALHTDLWRQLDEDVEFWMLNRELKRWLDVERLKAALSDSEAHATLKQILTWVLTSHDDQQLRKLFVESRRFHTAWNRVIWPKIRPVRPPASKKVG